MDSIWRYALIVALLTAATSGAGTFGFAIAMKAFAPELCNLGEPGRVLLKSRHPGAVAEVGSAPTSPLLGATAPPSKPAEEDTAPAADDAVSDGHEWVEVTDAVNMRRGASSADPVIKVQLEGTRLRVRSRDGGWVKVVESGTGEEGWVYGQYVKSVQAASHRADLD
jgi:uncharacterized protein YgiM (DUF1202 family)